MFPFDPPENIRNLWFSDVFRGIKREHWEEKGFSHKVEVFQANHLIKATLENNSFKVSNNKNNIMCLLSTLNELHILI